MSIDVHIYWVRRDLPPINAAGPRAFLTVDNMLAERLRGHELRQVYLHTYIAPDLRAFLLSRMRGPSSRFIEPGDDDYFQPDDVQL